ncbi:sigma-54-dependent transcriptional regulator [Evansella clarkii]|uniref:sigma-54-dependent transcriptional regulator n=1 Tax=Evansella clarkii TaxID=79879 RepID=UPI000998714C|nr:sigma-54 dependent transcriptional regulator [Evansella clarkii]
MEKTILLVEDNDKLRRLIKQTLQKEGYRLLEAPDGKTARKLYENEFIDIVLMDILLPDTTGIKLLEEWNTVKSGNNVCFILCTAYGEVEDAVQAMKMGAFDYLAKPIKAEELKVVIRRAVEWLELNLENRYLKQAFEEKSQLHDMAGKSEKMQRVFELIERVSKQNITVLLQGESGTGKSRCAHAIHLESDRKDGPFIKVNCAAIPSQLLESELFGYQKGAFTGATQPQKGKFEAADGGTLFLDEIGEISLELQAKLLQVTQEKTFIPLGSTVERKADIRLITATNRDLWQMVQRGEFREDLYYRLNIIGIHLPALREREEDIPLLVRQALETLKEEHGKNYELEKGLLKKLTDYPWPGNIRELHNALARAAVLSPDDILRLEDFPKEVREYRQEKDDKGTAATGLVQPGAEPGGENISLPDQLQTYEQQAIEDALAKAGGSQSKAAELLGISRQSLLYKVRKYGIEV